MEGSPGQGELAGLWEEGQILAGRAAPPPQRWGEPPGMWHHQGHLISPPWSHPLRFSRRVLSTGLRWAQQPQFWDVGGLLRGFPPACAGRAGSSPAHGPHGCLTVRTALVSSGALGGCAGTTSTAGLGKLRHGEALGWRLVMGRQRQAGTGRGRGRAAACRVIPTLGIAFPWVLHGVDAVGVCGVGDAGGSPCASLPVWALLGCPLTGPLLVSS